MPCRDYIPGEQDRRSDIKELSLIRASLCALLTVMEKNMTPDTFDQYIKSIDWKEAGVTKREFLSWWEDHKIEDEKRRKREAEEKREKEIRKAALAKLSAEEKKILGIK